MSAMLEYLPPREQHQITIGGYACPGLEAREVNHGRECNIFLDNRLGITIPAEHAQSVLWLLANALAIGAGYSCHGEHSVRANPYKVRVMEIDTTGERPAGQGV